MVICRLGEKDFVGEKTTISGFLRKWQTTKKRKRLDGETGRKNDKTNPKKPALRFAGLKIAEPENDAMQSCQICLKRDKNEFKTIPLFATKLGSTQKSSTKSTFY